MALASLNSMDKKQSLLPNEDKHIVSLAVYYFESLSPAMRAEILDVVETLINMYEREHSLVTVVWLDRSFSAKTSTTRNRGTCTTEDCSTCYK